VRISRLLVPLLVALATPLVCSPIPGARADFDPSGRHRPGGGTRPGGAARPGQGSRPGTEARPGQNPKPTGDETSGRGPGTEALIARYTGIVLSQPSAAFPLQRLAGLYRERDGDLKKLVADFEKRASTPGPEQASARIALAGVYKLDNRLQDAVRIYQEVIAARPKDPGPMQALALLQADRSNLTEARRLYADALALLTAQPDKEQVLRLLIKIALDQKDFTGAKAYHQSLIKLAAGSLLVRAELGRELMNRGEFGQAESEYRDVAAAAAGDNRALAPALADLARVLVKLRKNQEAMDVLKRALGVAGAEAGVRADLYSIMTEAFRAESKLPELIAILEGGKQGDFHYLATLGSLYEETGQVDKALGTYRKALGANPRHIDTRLKVIRILQAQGELDQAVREYEALIRAVPGNPDFVFELCDTLIQRGDRGRALTMLTQLEQRSGGDEEQLARVADFFERIEEHDRAMRILQRLAAGGGQDPQYIVDLGDRYFQQGDRKKALETWARIRVVLPNRAKALAALGEVYLDHDMTKEALDALREAAQLEPDNLRYQKNLAMALERAAASSSDARSRDATRYAEARRVWNEILNKAVAAGDRTGAREARNHIVTIWALTHELNAQVAPLARKFAATPPDFDAGWMLAEVHMRLQRLVEAEATLLKLTALEPGNAELFLLLEQVYLKEHKLDDAIKVLKRLAQMDPKRAREYFQRMAQYAAELYHDDDAVAYAARAVALAPDDADGHRKLGEMYKRRQDNERAIGEFRAAITKNDRLFLVYFDLAELLLARGQSEEADQLYRRVVRACPDDELVARAARLSMQLNLGRDTLESLERELLPVALGHPQKALYRRLLVDLYGAMAFPLVQRVRYGAPEEAVGARQALTKIGTRAVKPLLDALSDENQQQQLIAIEVLAFVENRNAGPSLFAYATGSAEQSLRVRAMIACGALRDPALLPRYKALLLPSADSPAILGGPIAVAAAWGVARMQDRRAAPLLGELGAKSTPELRALALIGLGMSQDKSASNLAAEVAALSDAGNVARAAAAFALGEMGASSRAAVLLGLSRSVDSLPREAGLLALARLDPAKARSVIAQAAFDTSTPLRKASLAAALVLSTREFRRATDPFAVPDGPLDVRVILQNLVPSNYSAKERAAALVALEEPLSRAAVDAVRTSPERAMIVADALLARADGPALAPWTDGIETLAAPDRAKAEQAASHILRSVGPGFASLVRHPMADLRIRAIRVLARQPDAASHEAVVDALGDDDESVQRAALAVLSEISSEAAVKAVAAILKDNANWALRVRAAKALEALGSGRADKGAIAALSRAAQQDSFALVRLACVEALGKIAPDHARDVLQAVAKTDAEPEVRETARKLVKN
jgi:cellulose synthase operon protein C